MVSSVAAGFEELKSNLEVTGLQEATISNRQQAVRRVVAAGMTVIDDFLTGSYARSTMIGPLSEADIDIFVVLDPKYYYHYNGQNGGPAGLLDYTKRTLRKTYTRTPDISRNGQAVTIRFKDFVVDVVVGFNRKGGGYIMANAVNNRWLETDPKKHVAIISNANKMHGGGLVPLIKMLKGWNKTHGAFFRSFHIEVLALEILDNVRISDFSSGARFFFDRARTIVKGKNLDPAGYGDDVGGYIDTFDKVTDAISRRTRSITPCRAISGPRQCPWLDHGVGRPVLKLLPAIWLSNPKWTKHLLKSSERRNVLRRIACIRVRGIIMPLGAGGTGISGLESQQLLLRQSSAPPPSHNTQRNIHWSRFLAASCQLSWQFSPASLPS